jgi:hypothetical protein
MDRGWLNLECCLDKNEGVRLYKGFVEFLSEIGKYRLTNTYLFCPLPSNSYHVTVWDGLNDSNLRTVLPSYRPEVGRFLRNLPESFLTDNGFVNETSLSPLVTNTDWSITLKFDKLTSWGNKMLAACLVPADRDSVMELKRIIEYREALSAIFRERFGAKMRSDYCPHVTLGYFANKEYAELATSQIDRWTELTREKVDNLTITFNTISLYGFTDMATFFKRAERG